MNRAKYWRDQSGYTLIEVVITSALTLVVMSALTSVVLTSVRAANTATGRVEASSQIRNFEYRAYDDFAHSGVPAASCSVSVPCSTAPLVLSGPQWHSSPPSASNYQVDDTPPKQTVVVNLTVVVLGYSESQTFRFYPRLNP
jgi:prepilin-type N-terminal cleavage/methylation domain-containing protein